MPLLEQQVVVSCLVVKFQPALEFPMIKLHQQLVFQLALLLSLIILAQHHKALLPALDQRPVARRRTVGVKPTAFRSNIDSSTATLVSAYREIG